jgi:3-dehydroquinate synthase
VKRVRVSLGDRSYDIVIGHGLISALGQSLKKLKAGRDAIVISSSTVEKIYFKKIENSIKKCGMSVKLELVPDSEKAKSHNILIGLLNRIGAYDKNKIPFIIALGGGVIGDLAGFAASIYKRGIPYIQIPTTLLAQVDSAIGGKVAIDLPVAKNLIGSFYQPRAVISDTSVLKSLPPRQISNGLSECIKYGVVKDKSLFEYLENNYHKILALESDALERVVFSASKLKADIVEEDEFDRTGSRAILNYGHTIGHAIEAASNYSKRYYHGEAIAAGMVIAARISSMLGLLRESERLRIESLIKECGLPAGIKGLKISSIYAAHLHDKKFIHGKNRFILPTGIGSVRMVEGITPSMVIKSIRECMV